MFQNITFNILPKATSIKKATLKEQNIYGANRIGIIEQNKVLVDNSVTLPVEFLDPEVILGQIVNGVKNNKIGQRRYEITNYLGNVNAVITDRRSYNSNPVTSSLYEAVVVNTADYYPFGMQMPERHYSNENYRYAYNGMEVDPEMKGDGNSYTTEFRQYDPRLGRWLSLDPLMAQFPSMSPYCAFDNNPIYYTDIYGLNSNGGTGGPDDKTIKMEGTRYFTDKKADAREILLLPDSPKNRTVYTFEYEEVNGEKMYSTWTYIEGSDGKPSTWEGGVGKNYPQYCSGVKYVDVNSVMQAQLLAKADDLNGDIKAPEDKKTQNQAGTDVKTVNTGIKSKPVIKQTNDSKIEETKIKDEPKDPPSISSHAQFKLRDDWFEKGKQRELAYSTLRLISNYLKENPNQKFAIHIYVQTGGKGKSNDLVGGDDGFFSPDKLVTKYSGNSLSSLAWGRYVTVRDIIRQQSGIKNATFNFVPHYDSYEHKFVVKPIK